MSKSKLKELEERIKKLEEQKAAADAQLAAYSDAKNNLPEGDPGIEALKAKAMAEVDKQIALQEQIVAALKA